MTEKVSIITPCHNNEKDIAETIKSVLNQTYDDWEMLIVDDCSTDNSVDVVQSFEDSRIKLFENKSNQGAAYSRNVALKEASGKWIAFLDADDLWDSRKLEKQIRFMSEHDYKFSCTYYREFVDGKEPSCLVISPKKISRKDMLNCDLIGCLTVMYDAEAVGIIQVDPSIKKRNDYALWLQITGKGIDCHTLEEPLASYRVKANSMSHTSTWKLLKAHYHLFRVQEKRTVAGAWFCAFRNGFYILKKRKHNKKSL